MSDFELYALVLLVFLGLLVKRAFWGPQVLFARTALAQLVVGVLGLLGNVDQAESFGMTVSLLLILTGLLTGVFMLCAENVWMLRRLLKSGQDK